MCKFVFSPSPNREAGKLLQDANACGHVFRINKLVKRTLLEQLGAVPGANLLYNHQDAKFIIELSGDLLLQDVG
jgi:hypothetical protein